MTPKEAYEARVAQRIAFRRVHPQQVAQTSRNVNLTDLTELVVAARVVAFEDQSPEALGRLDRASEAFAEFIPWEDDPADALGDNP